MYECICKTVETCARLEITECKAYVTRMLSLTLSDIGNATPAPSMGKYTIYIYTIYVRS